MPARTPENPDDPPPAQKPTRSASLSDADNLPAGHYLDYEVEIGLGRDQDYPLAVIDSPAGEAREVLHFPFDSIAQEDYLKSLEIALLRSGGARRQVLSPEEQAVQDFGRQLFDSLFTGEARTRYDMSSNIARQRGLGLRLKLRIQAPELARLPWEFLYDQRQGEYVCMSRDTPIVRYIELPQPIQPLEIKPPLCILGMVSSPAKLPVLDVEREMHRLERALAGLQAENLVNLTWLPSATWRDLQRAMRQGPWHIFHFIGHGGFDPNADEGILAFEDEKGQAQLLLATEVGRLLADHRSLRLCLLNACEGARGGQSDIFSSSAAILVRRGLPAVLAMQYPITDIAAIEFSRTFYETLSDGLPVDAAVCEARKAVSLAITNTIEWGAPVLYMRSPQGVIFNLPELRKGRHKLDIAPKYIDREAEAQLERLYTEGLAAFWVEDWDRACLRFEAVLDARPDYPEAAEKLDEARRQRRLAALYARGQEALQARNWEQAIIALETLCAESPDYKKAADQLKTAHRQKELADLYDEARQLHSAGQWHAVVNVFAQIHALDARYTDEDDMLATAAREVEAHNRRAELESLYRQAVHSMDTGRWQKARELFSQIQQSEPGFLETEKLLARVVKEIEQAEQEQLRQSQVSTLYEQAHGLARAKQWRNALEKLDDIRALDGEFADPDGIADRARAALEKEEQEARRQSELAALYAEAVRLLKAGKYQEALEKWGEIHAWDPKYPDRQKVQRTARKQLAKLTRRAPKLKGLSLIRILRYEWFALLAAIGFGFARLASQNIPLVFNAYVPLIYTWALRGLIDGIIAALVLQKVIRERTWRVLLTFAIFWALFFGVTVIYVMKKTPLILLSVMFSLAPVLSIIISSIFTRKWKRWPTYVLIFIGWILAWNIGQSVAGTILKYYIYRWPISDAMAGGIGLFLTLILLREKTTISSFDYKRKLLQNSRLSNGILLICAFASIVLVRVIWGFITGKLNIWESGSGIFPQFLSFLFLGGLYGFFVATIYQAVAINWDTKTSLVLVFGWGLGLGLALISDVSWEGSFGIIWAILAGLAPEISSRVAKSSAWPVSFIFIVWAFSWFLGITLSDYILSQNYSFMTLSYSYDLIWGTTDGLIIILGLSTTLFTLKVSE